MWYCFQLHHPLLELSPLQIVPYARRLLVNEHTISLALQFLVVFYLCNWTEGVVLGALDVDRGVSCGIVADGVAVLAFTTKGILYDLSIVLIILLFFLLKIKNFF